MSEHPPKENLTKSFHSLFSHTPTSQENPTIFPSFISDTINSNTFQLNQPKLTHDNLSLEPSNPLAASTMNNFPSIFEELDYSILLEPSPQGSTLPSFMNKGPKGKVAKSMVIEDQTDCSIDLEPYTKSAELLESKEFHDLFIPRRSTRSSNLNTQSKLILKASANNNVAPLSKSSPLLSRKRSAWTTAEDEELKHLYNTHGARWAKIASLMVDRTGKQVRDRYLNVLVPNINKAAWTEEEDKTILSMLEKIGAQWKKISDCLEGRTEMQAKNRYYTYLKKKVKRRKGTETETSQISEEDDDGSEMREEEKEMSESRVEISESPSFYSGKTPDPTDMISYENSQQENESTYNYWMDFDSNP